MSLPSYIKDYCPYCGSGISRREVEGQERDYCSSCDRILWRNPKLAVAAALKKGDEILMVKRGIQPDKGMYSVPAGFADNGEKPEKAVGRELEEETGIEIGEEEFFCTILS